MADLTITQEDLDKKIEAAVDKATAKLGTKNKDLITELKNARKRVKDFEGFDAADVKKALQLAKKTEADSLLKEGEYQKALDLSTKASDKLVAKLTKERDEDRAEKSLMIKEAALNKAMDKAGVTLQMREAVAAMKMRDITLIEKDGKLVATIGDESVTDALKTWAGTDDGKNFVGDGGQGGGGGGGGNKGPGTVNPWAKDTRNLSQQGVMERDHPDQAKTLKREAGVAA